MEANMNSSESSPTPCPNSTVNQLYHFYEAHLGTPKMTVPIANILWLSLFLLLMKFACDPTLDDAFVAATLRTLMKRTKKLRWKNYEGQLKRYYRIYELWSSRPWHRARLKIPAGLNKRVPAAYEGGTNWEERYDAWSQCRQKPERMRGMGSRSQRRLIRKGSRNVKVYWIARRSFSKNTSNSSSRVSQV